MNKKLCQSCGMPLDNNDLDNRGTNADQSRNEEYCYYCYINGEFKEPNMSFDEMLNRGLKGIEESNNGKLGKWVFKKTYPKMLRNLKRWK